MTEKPTKTTKLSLSKANNPFLQAGVVFLTMLAILLIGQLMKSQAPEGYGQRLPWIIVTAMLLLFAAANSIICLTSDKPVIYWNRSVISYILLAGAGILLGWVFSGISLRHAGSFQWLFFVVSFSYLVFISIVNLIRIIVAFAQKEEWHAPRPRNRDRS